MNAEVSPRGINPEYQTLPDDASAVVMQSSRDLKMYYVVLGNVVEYSDTQSLDNALKENEDLDWLPVPLFDPTHSITLQPLTQRRGIMVSFSSNEKGNAKLQLLASVVDRRDPIREAEIDLSTLREKGLDFDIQKGEHDYDGTILGRDAAQLLYDFQLEQGQFDEGLN